MPKKIYVTTVLLLGMIFCLLAWRRMGQSEPVYKGRPVSSWLEGHVASNAAHPAYGSPGWLEADAALRKIGTNAIPVLLKMIAAKDYPRPVINFWNLAARYHLLSHPYRYAFNQNEEALFAFKMLGQSAAPAVPGLTGIYERKATWFSKDCAAWALGSIGRAAQPALPVLLHDFSSTNKQERFDAVSAVMEIGGPTNLVLPALISAAKDPDADVRWNAIVGLGMYEERARIAVRVLLGALQDTAKVGNIPITNAVETALWRIAPEKVGKPLMIAEDSSMSNGARTHCSIEFQFQGQRKTIIPAGQLIPCVGDFWNNEPQGKISVYQRDSTNNQETSLGEFEIQDMPATNPNVSLVCVVVEGKTFLCARDNLAEKFLEIRKVR